ncbi:hypothetical protein [Thiolapillus sp.]|uniref:hypothetical protein n=3 Tax=Thiolapillus sp. TaxID=2017437 RepID=UPI0025F50657|nr:hypothetical protein [Thiolapillus sp.]
MIDFGTSQSPKIDSAFDNLLVPQPSWSPSTTQQLRKLVAAPYLSPNDWTPRSEAYFVFPLAQGTPGKQCGLAATGVYQPSLRSPWLAALDQRQDGLGVFRCPKRGGFHASPSLSGPVSTVVSGAETHNRRLPRNRSRLNPQTGAENSRMEISQPPRPVCRPVTLRVLPSPSSR